MRTVEQTRPRPGLSVPVVTIVDDAGELLESDQRALVRHVVQDGYGADILFAAGTTVEWDRLPARVMQRVVAVSAEEVAKLEASRATDPRSAPGVEVWAGITALSAEETLENLDFA